MLINLDNARQTLAEAYIECLSDVSLPYEWSELARILRSEEAPRTYTPALGAALLARSCDATVDPLSIKENYSERSFSLRLVAHHALVPMATKVKLDLNSAGREPLNNQPFFRYSHYSEIERLSSRAKPYFDILKQHLAKLEFYTTHEARLALTAFLRVCAEASIGGSENFEHDDRPDNILTVDWVEHGQRIPASLNLTQPYALALTSHGSRGDYACEVRPIEGGQAQVFWATHKPTGRKVALKKIRSAFSHRVARMKREIEVGCMLNGHPHAMPILDFSQDYTWFVMPRAQGTAQERHFDLQQTPALLALLQSICSVLAEAHDRDYVHRDIKPANILLLDGRWVLADWGIVRRPHGQTTDPQHTKAGIAMGSDGFAAPELQDDAHHADARADIYSLGQLVGWAVTGQNPQANIPLVPKSGPWRSVVRIATKRNPDSRPASVKEFLDLAIREVDSPAVSAVRIAESLTERILQESTGAVEEMLDLAVHHTDDSNLYSDFLVKIDVLQIIPGLLTDPERAVEIVRAMSSLFAARKDLPEYEANQLIPWFFSIAQRAASSGEFELLDECCAGMFYWSSLRDQWESQDAITEWLRELKGETASSVAQAIIRHPQSARHFDDLISDLRIDRRLRWAIKNVK
ncbi:restriction endonuclease, SacI family [Streptomyces polygonati]|uniref:non-specific serine/threonine protein kinase n=1 Tax=Streptomyces polygonati TaxID=1617087 RepID=A0ABV8HQ04_9ACTN